MGKAFEFLQGKKTYILVLVAIVLVLGGGADPQGLGLDFSSINNADLQKAVLVAIVGTLKAAWDRKQAG